MLGEARAISVRIKSRIVFRVAMVVFPVASGSVATHDILEAFLLRTDALQGFTPCVAEEPTVGFAGQVLGRRGSMKRSMEWPLWCSAGFGLWLALDYSPAVRAPPAPPWQQPYLPTCRPFSPSLP